MSAETSELPPGIPRVGDVFAGKYRIERLLGLGGMGVVVAAKHLHLDESVAIKLLLPAVAKDAELVARFLREGRAAVKIHSEHVARVLDVATDASGAPYMVMEYLEGGDLSAALAHHGPLPVAVTVDYVLQACEALAEAHALGIVHRDLKPGNLFLSTRSDGTHIVKVLDFGISKRLETPAEPMWSITKTRTSMGSPAYMSPEQMRSARKVDQRADIWALGTTMYELLTGRPPFDGDTMPELCAAILQDTPASIRALRTDVPPGFEAVILRCLEKDPAQRFASIVELAAALAEFGSPAARGSAERILRVTHAIGRRSSGAHPSSVSSGEFKAAAAVRAPRVNTASAWGKTERQRARTGLWIAIASAAFLVAACVVFAVVLLVRRGVSAGTRGEPGTTASPSASTTVAPMASVAPEASSSAPTSSPPSAAPSTKAPPGPRTPPTHSGSPPIPSSKPKPNGTANDRQG